jgi:hypothetical protein
MWGFLAEVIQRTFIGFSERMEAFGPYLLAMFVILSIGLLTAVALRLAVRFALPRVGFDRFAQRMGLALLLEKGGVVRPSSDFVAVLLGWAVFGIFVLLAIGSLNLQFAMDLVSRAFIYLPQLLVAVALVVLGFLIAGVVRRSVLIAAVNGGLPSARLLAGCVHSGLMVLFVAMALEQLGVGRQVILSAFTILFGGVVLALSLAFGLAGRDLAREALEHLVRRTPEQSQEGLHHL